MKKILLLSSLLSSVLLAEGFEYKGNISVESSYADHEMEGKRDRQNALRLELGFKHEVDDGHLVFNGKGILDNDDEERRYFDATDLYYKHDFENSDLLIGRNTRFWGAMEFYNHTDNFNMKDWRDNPFDYDSKIGSNNIAYTQYFGDSEFALIAKVHETGQRIQDQESVNNFLPPIYNNTLETEDGPDRPTVYLKYSGSAEEIQVDYAIIYQNGYDEQRYLAPTPEGKLRQHAYLVNKVMAYGTVVEDSTIYKSELAYTSSDDEKVSSYAQISVGLEHTFYSVLGKSDLGLIGEYYRYETYDDTKLGAKEFGNLFQNDVTLGFRFSLNDSADSDLLAGVFLDQDNQEKLIFAELNTRLFGNYKLKLTYQHLSPEEGSTFQEVDLSKIEFGYYF